MFYSTYPCLYWEHNSKVTLESFCPCNPTPDIPSKYLSYPCRGTSRRLTNQIPTTPADCYQSKGAVDLQGGSGCEDILQPVCFFSFSILILLDSEIHTVQLLEAVTCPETKGGIPPFSSEDHSPKKNDRHFFFQQKLKLSAVIINPQFFLNTGVLYVNL